jgi:hypothetical protein
MIITLFAFRQAVGDNGGSSGAIGVLSPDGGVPGDDWGVFYPVSIGVPIVQGAFMAGVALAAVGVLGLSSRTGGVGWRGALSTAAAGGARLRTIAVSSVAVGAALAVAAFALAETANVSDPNGTLQIPAIDNALAGSHPVPYTQACSASHGGSALTVCLHPAYRAYLPQVTAALDQVTGELSGLPGLPGQASQVPAAAVAQWAQGGPGSGLIVGRTYEFVLSASVRWSTSSSMIEDAVRQDLTHAIIVGTGKMISLPDGSKAWAADTPAQQAVVDGVLKVQGTPPYPVPQSGNGPAPAGLSTPAQQATIRAAAAKFAALPPATRDAWLAANLAALKAGTITLAQLP